MSYPLKVPYCPNCGMPPEYCEYGPTYDKCKPWLKEHFPHLLPQPPAAHAATSAAAAAGAAAPAAAGAGSSDAGAGGVADAAAKLAAVSLESGGAPAAAGSSAAAGAGGVAAGGAGGESDDDEEGEEGGEEGDKKKKKSKRGGQVLRGGPKASGKSKGGQIVISKKDRGKHKYVTSIVGLDLFDVKLKEAASTLGKKFGTGATVGKTATGQQEITVQGDMTYDLPELLESLFGIPEDAIVVKD